jgi:hypothetical protein
MKNWLLTLASCLAVAPLWLAAGGVICDSCYAFIPLTLNHQIAWQELDVHAGERHVLSVFRVEGEASAELVMFDGLAREAQVAIELTTVE